MPSSTTFVFVTPRIWRRGDPTLAQWQDNKRAEKIWKDVRAIDAIALEDWLDQHAAVATRTAHILRVITEPGAHSSDEYWEEYAARFKPSLTEKVLLCDRDEQTKELLSRLDSGPQEIPWRADSPDEVVAFAVAAIRSAEPELRKFLEARTLVLDTEEAARQLARRANMIYIPRAAALAVSGLLSQHNPTIIPLGRDSARLRVNTLNRPTTRALSAAIETMGYDADAAYQLARTCGRSVTILGRRIPNGDAGKPSWVDGKRTLIPALLCGGWEGTREGDKEILRILADVDHYETYEEALQPLVKFQDPPIDREGDVWKIRAPVDAFVLLGHLVSKRDLDNLQLVTEEVFGEIDPLLDRADDDEPLLLTKQMQHRYSEWLRDGLATTLLQIAVLHQEAEVTIPGATPQAFVDQLVGNLPGLTKDYRLIASLKNQLPLLMEAAPRPLLSALERLLEGDLEVIRPIFRSGGGLFSPTSPHTYLLWALETLAWDPDYLARVALIVARLAAIDPGGRTISRPINSLKEIFLEWNPGTNASQAQRLAVLDQIIIREPSVGWLLTIQLLPQNNDVSHPTARPRYREAGASQREVLTWAFIFEAQRQIVRRALDLVGDDLGRWGTIIRSMANFEQTLREQTYELLQEATACAGPEWRFSMWEMLLKEVNKHRAFPNAQWSLKDPELARLDAILKGLEPSDKLEKLAWLFDTDHPNVPGKDTSKHFEAVDEARRAAVREIRAAIGDAGLLTLADRVRFPQFIAIAAVDETTEISMVDSLIDDSLGKCERLDMFAFALSARAEQKFGSMWRDRVSARARSGRLNTEQITTLLLGLDDGPATWDLAESLGTDVDKLYWQKKRAWWIKASVAEAERAAVKYLTVGRATAALDAIHNQLKDASVPLILNLLDAAITEINAKKPAPNNMFVYNLGEVFQHLRKRDDAPLIEIAKREYAYLPLLGHQHPQLTLHEIMAQEPSFYINILSDVFKPTSGDGDGPVTEERRARARFGYQLLSSFHRVPGCDGSDVNFPELVTWTNEVRRLAAEADRAQIADQYIGHVLAHGPNDPSDQAWPHRAIRDLIELIASDDLEIGMRTERFNMRGAWTKAVYEGGGQERALADQARTWAKASVAHPRTSAMLNTIAAVWESSAEEADVRARQDQMRFE